MSQKTGFKLLEEKEPKRLGQIKRKMGHVPGVEMKKIPNQKGGVE